MTDAFSLVLRNVAEAPSSLETEPMFAFGLTQAFPKLVSGLWVLRLMNTAEPGQPWSPVYGEISEAIAQASNDDPLFSGEHGAYKTAALLVAIAWYESRFHPNIVHKEADGSTSFGLYQIQAPTAKVPGNLLLLPRTASYVAIDLLRQSFRQCASAPEDERLAWYASSGNGCPRNPLVREQSKRRVGLARRLYEKNPPPEDEDTSSFPKVLPPLKGKNS
jgi:hypothetical protein